MSKRIPFPTNDEAVTPEQQLPDKIAAKIHVAESGCWLWAGSRDQLGYGMVWADHRIQRSHRVTYQLLIGPIPDGLTLDHLCRVRSCANPEHLEPVTQRVNTQRGRSGAPQRERTHCPQGHAYEGENLYLSPEGFRVCRTCRREARRKWEAKQKV